MNERDHERVLDDLAGLQARLRGEEPPEVAPRTVQMLPLPPGDPTTPDAIPTLHLRRGRETVSVSHDDLTLLEDASEGDPDGLGGAAVIPMPGLSDARVADITDRLARLELELTDVLRGLEDAEELFGPMPTPLPVEESSGDALTDLQRLVARRLEAEPGE